MTILMLAISVSLDSLGIGVSYGIKKIRIATPSLLIIVSMTLSVLTMTWLAGQAILTIIPLRLAEFFSSLLLICLGTIFIIQAVRDKKKNKQQEDDSRLRLQLPKNPLRALILIIRSPVHSDLDHSGTIDLKEALLLGTALSVDAVAIGLASAAYDLSLPFFLAATAAINFTLLRWGEFLGRKSSRLIPEGKLKTASGTIIILMGLIKLL